MAASILVPVRSAVIAGIKTALNEPRVSCTYGWEGSDETRRREQVFTNRASATHDPAALKSGRNFRNERMDFDIVVLILGVNRSTEETDQRALEIGQCIEEFMADHKNNELGVPGLQWIRMARMELNNRFATTGTITEITYTVTYDARLT